jgi:hypothetical protein
MSWDIVVRSLDGDENLFQETLSPAFRKDDEAEERKINRHSQPRDIMRSETR